MARRPGEMQSLMGCSWFRLGVNSRILVFCCRAGVGRWSAERRRSARGIWLEATHAINAHRSDRSGGNLLDLRVSQATQMPWCAGTSKSISGIARGEQADKMKDILGRVYEYPLCAEWNR